jgi:hypothetical protein
MYFAALIEGLRITARRGGIIFDGGNRRIVAVTAKENSMAWDLPEERKKFIAELIQRLGNEDWGRWLEDEKQVIDSMNLPANDEIARTCREQWYDHLLRKIEDEMDYLRKQG